MARFSDTVSRTYEEFIIIPGEQRSDINEEDVSLGAIIGEGTERVMYVPLGWFSAAMQCVSGYELGVALPQYGGCAVLPRSCSVEEQVETGKRIKKEKAGFNSDVITVSPDMHLAELMKLQATTGYSSFPVVDTDGILVGLMTEKRYHPGRDLGLKVADRMMQMGEVVTAGDDISLTDANDMLLSRGLGTLPIVDKSGAYVASVFWSDIKKHVDFPDEFVDKQGRYRFAGAVSTHEKDFERARALVEDAECDILCVDTSQLKGDYGTATVKRFREAYPTMPIIAGNVVDKKGFLSIASAGADVVKIGQGPGFGCTTQQVKKTGRGQATAVVNGIEASYEFYRETGRRVLTQADGGIGDTGKMFVAYALGSDLLMMGSYFGQFTESEAPLVNQTATVLFRGKEIKVPVMMKEYWGEASLRAANVERYDYDDDSRFVPEGDDGIIPHRGSIHGSRGIANDIAFVKKGLKDSGARTPQEFSERVVLEQLSNEAMKAGRSQL